MTTKRSKGFASLDLVLPVAPHYRTDPQILKDVETMRTNAASRWAKDDYTQPLSNYHHTNESSSKISALARPKVEILRANSPTLKRLLAVRAKLEKYSNTIARTLSASRQSVRSIRETPYPAFHEKQSSVVSQPPQVPTKPVSQPPPPPPPLVKQIKCQTSLADGPVDKITYEKTWSRSGNVKQKCSLEIWLPKAGLDDGDDDDDRRISPKGNFTEGPSQPISSIKSRRSSVVKITPTSIVTNIETKSVDTGISKKPDSALAPRVYHYGDYIMDLPEERPRSSKSVTTVKSDGAGSLKSLRRQQTRSHTRRQSVSTNHSEEILRFGTIEVSTSAKILSVPPKPTSASHEQKPESTESTSPIRETKAIPKPTNSAMITELMQKYSLIKKNHQELTQAKLQLEKPTTDSKAHTKGHTSPPRPPPIPDSTSLVPSDNSTLLGKKLLANDISSAFATTDPNNPNHKLLERRSTPHKPSPSDMYPHLRIFSLANQRQHRPPSASIPTGALLPTVAGKKSEEPLRTLQRSKTLDVVLDIPLPVKPASRAVPSSENPTSYLSQRSSNGPIDQAPSRTSRRSGQTLRSEQQKTDTSSQRSYHSSISANKALTQFNQRNFNRNYLVPE